jgi:putative lipoprotein
MGRVFIIALAIIVALAVGGGVLFAILSSTPGDLSRPTWKLTRLVVNGLDQPLSASHRATIRFLASQRQVTGTGGCNSFGGSYTLIGNQVRFGDLRSTLVACADADAMEQESQYFQGLSQVTNYQVSGNTLTLSDGGGHVAMTFQAG